MFERQDERPKGRRLILRTKSSPRRSFLDISRPGVMGRRFFSEAEIGHAGERHFVSSLKANDYTIIQWDTKGEGKTDIVASKNGQLCLFQVKSAIEPNLPAGMSEEEEIAIRRRAVQYSAWAYLIQIQLDFNLNVVGDIRWNRVWPKRLILKLR